MRKSVCRVHTLSDSLEQEVLKTIQEQLSSPSWKDQVRETLEGMVKKEFGDSAEGLKRQLEAINRQITNIVDAIV
jgi:hypothetical protein